MGSGSLAYHVMYLIHLSCVVVGFGSSFVYPVFAVRARKLPLREAHALNHAAVGVAPYLTSYPIYGAGAAGVLLVVLSDKVFSFSATWISVAMLVFVLAVLVTVFLHMPNLRAMDALEAELAAASPDVTSTELVARTEAPPQVAEYEERGQKAAMYGGLIHLFWLILMIDMIWKPGTAAF